MTVTNRRRNLLALCIAAMLGLTAVVIVEADAQSAEAYGGYQSARAQFDGDLKAAQSQGYTRDDLAPVVSDANTVEASSEPVWVGSRAEFYRQRASSLEALRASLSRREAEVMAQAHADATAQLATVRTQVDTDAGLGVDPDTVAALKSRLDALGTVTADATRILDIRGAAANARSLLDDATAAGTAQQQENAAIAAAAADLKAKNQGSLPALQKVAASALAQLRDDATVAGFLDAEKQFNGLAGLNRVYRRAEQYSERAKASDVDQVATAAAALQRYQPQVHDLLAKGIPSKAIVVSLGAQELWAYESGKGDPVLDTIVTTGRPALSTDVGPMAVLRKNAPWKMVSPWPKGSPYYYEPTDVRKVLWFTDTGEGLHDASWRSWYGPGSNVGDGTHGCVNLPGSTVDFVYDWAPVGTPVIVIPGDGGTQSQQMSEDSIDTAAGQTVKGA